MMESDDNNRSLVCYDSLSLSLAKFQPGVLPPCQERFQMELVPTTTSDVCGCVKSMFLISFRTSKDTQLFLLL